MQRVRRRMPIQPPVNRRVNRKGRPEELTEELTSSPRNEVDGEQQGSGSEDLDGGIERIGRDLDGRIDRLEGRMQKGWPSA